MLRYFKTIGASGLLWLMLPFAGVEWQETGVHLAYAQDRTRSAAWRSQLAELTSCVNAASE